MVTNTDKKDCLARKELIKVLEERGDIEGITEIIEKCPIEECPMTLLHRIDYNVALNKESLKTIAEQQSKHMLEIAANTKEISRGLQGYAETMRNAVEENQKLVSLVAGKKQVPLSIFLVTLFTFIVGTLMVIASFTKMQMALDESSLKISSDRGNTQQELNEEGRSRQKYDKKLWCY